MSVMDQAPEVTGEMIKDTTRDRRIDQAAVDMPTYVTGGEALTTPAPEQLADTAARQDAGEEIVARPSEHIINLNNASSEVPADEKTKANLDASTSGDQATRLMKELNPAPGSIGEQVIHEAMQTARENATGVLPSIDVLREEIARREQAEIEAAQAQADAKDVHVGKIRTVINRLFNSGEK